MPAKREVQAQALLLEAGHTAKLVALVRAGAQPQDMAAKGAPVMEQRVPQVPR